MLLAVLLQGKTHSLLRRERNEECGCPSAQDSPCLQLGGEDIKVGRWHSPQSPAKATTKMPPMPTFSDLLCLLCTPTHASSQEVGAKINIAL